MSVPWHNSHHRTAEAHNDKTVSVENQSKIRNVCGYIDIIREYIDTIAMLVELLNTFNNYKSITFIEDETECINMMLILGSLSHNNFKRRFSASNVAS